MEIRAGKVIFSSSGGTAEKNSVSCKISLPTAWIKALGFDKDDREAELHFDGHTISICKKQTADSYIALHKQSGHTLKKYSFYDNNELCTVIYADHTDKTVFAENFTDDLVKTAFGKKQFPQLAQQFLANQHDMVANYPYMFSRDGKMNMWGRSICYRFAATAPLSLWEYDKSGDVNYGWIRRIASSTLLQFLENPKFLEEGVPTMGFYGPFAPAVQIYSCRGSVYWCGKAFLSLLLPENSDFWSATENNGPWDKELKKGNVYNKFQPGTNLLITNYPNSGGAEMRSWCHETVAKDWQKFRSTENYNKLAYNTEFPWMADGKNGEISMNYGTKNQKGEWEVLRLYTFQSFKDGIYRRDAVLETDSTVRYQLADIPLPNGILRVDKVSVSEPTEICLGHYSLPRLNGVFKETSRRVGKLDIPVIDNGEYELAMIPLAGWDKLYTSYPKGLHPVSDECALIMASDKLAGSKIYVTLQLWKKNEGKNGFTKKELNPVRAIDISEDKKQVTVRLDTKEIKTVLFE